MTKIKENISTFLQEYKSLIYNSRFIRIILAGVISSFGSKISYFALLRKVYIISNGKITDLGFLTIFEMIPSIVFGIFAGIIIDKFPRKWIMIISDLFSGLAILSAVFVNDLNLIYLITFIKATVNVFRLPSQSAFEPNLVDKDDIPLLNSFKSSTNSLIQIIGSATGAAIVGFLGAKNAFIIDAITFWVSGLIIITINIKEQHMIRSKEFKSKYLNEFIEGTSIMWKNSKLKLMILIELFVTFAMSMQGVLIYIFIRETLKMGDMAEMAWGTLLSSLGIGAIIGSFYIGVKVKYYSNPFKLFLNILLFDSIIFGLFVFNTYFPISIFLFGLLGFVGSAHMIILTSVLQRTVSDNNRGKVFSVLSMLNGPIGILSILIGTTAASFITARNVLFIAAGIEALIAIGVRFTTTFKNVDKDINLDIALK